jgi:hypothetical protein
MHYIIDTNVPVTANGKSDAGPACVKAATERLEQLKMGEILVLDTAFIILSEYDRNIHSIGQPGPGDAFYLWALRQRNNPTHCEQILLATEADGSFSAFPTDPDLATFDLSDRKFVALALTHPARPTIVNATDTDWHKDHIALVRNGIHVEFICPAEMTRQRD